MISNQPGPLDSAEYRRLRVGETDYLVALVGSGEPVLLVHGFPRARGSRPSGGPPNRVPNARHHRGAATQLADAAAVWRPWTTDLRAETVPGGHFIPEEAPQELADALVRFLSTS